MLCKKTFFFNF